MKICDRAAAAVGQVLREDLGQAEVGSRVLRVLCLILGQAEAGG